MHGVVHGDEPTSGGCVLFARIPRVDENGRVVVPVEKDEILLARHNERRVDELRDFAVDEEHAPRARHAVGVVVDAYRVVDT